ncbi:hypothetical protein KSP40_PGU019011 [Platanthera guangdongensis]|uniref:F-box domain-containing protein n=1 Tax=Platanthera guangdongensis TaxID=2320717 RepID=A0ABR2MZ68_9ASPA
MECDCSDSQALEWIRWLSESNVTTCTWHSFVSNQLINALNFLFAKSLPTDKFRVVYISINSVIYVVQWYLPLRANLVFSSCSRLARSFCAPFALPSRISNRLLAILDFPDYLQVSSLSVEADTILASTVQTRDFQILKSEKLPQWPADSNTRIRSTILSPTGDHEAKWKDLLAIRAKVLPKREGKKRHGQKQPRCDAESKKNVDIYKDVREVGCMLYRRSFQFRRRQPLTFYPTPPPWVDRKSGVLAASCSVTAPDSPTGAAQPRPAAPPPARRTIARYSNSQHAHLFFPYPPKAPSNHLPNLQILQYSPDWPPPILTCGNFSARKNPAGNPFSSPLLDDHHAHFPVTPNPDQSVPQSSSTPQKPSNHLPNLQILQYSPTGHRQPSHVETSLPGKTLQGRGREEAALEDPQKSINQRLKNHGRSRVARVRRHEQPHLHMDLPVDRQQQCCPANWQNFYCR